MINDVYKYLRLLARSNYFQNLYSLSKDMPSLRLFENERDFTDIQMSFIRFLNYYSSVLLDIALGDVDELVLDNDIYTDSYMLYKTKKDKNITPKMNIKNDREVIGGSKWIFKSKMNQKKNQ
jgi:hypothetical protein